ncbi:P-loop containing nucleoside triphosphate hydrolase protein [Colletotrichum navitas]|uniref:P-loop containing nucleoside triphosphate hydrolase protein n=1 Tax=Colletotrichum navitas TaxID=681940 RepID=A0AAD8V9J2_9PEZI|nr:P-loop containing nucleoside triphosphate hydrolase protein [Colletotrichum navitas]KAK1596570.1 P-loop containing nucleoside triphosphate hydrolase protein [Colletotrichum navitas]
MGQDRGPLAMCILLPGIYQLVTITMDEYHTKHTAWYQASVEAFGNKAAKQDLASFNDSNSTPNPDMIVAARLRPILEDEVAAGLIRGVFPRKSGNGAVDIHQVRKHVKPLGPPTLISTSVRLDRAYGPEDTSEQIYQDLVQPLVPWAWCGGVSTMFAYGQTGSGKTFTVSAIEKLVAQSLMDGNLEGERKVYACIIELAGNSSFDLLNSRKPISILEDSFGVTQLAGAMEFEVTEAATLLDLIDRAASFRRTASTLKNDASSRSHAICRIRIENPEIPTDDDGLLYLVDLAGSEAARDVANHTADRMKEAREINTSLSVLKDCIRGRATIDAASLTGKPKKPTHIPFRQSSLTKILKHVFDPAGRRSCKTVVVACVNPSLPDAGAGKNTLKYAEMLRVLLPKTKSQAYNPKVPSSWSNGELKSWINANSGSPEISGDVLAPFETGALLLRLPTPEFLTRCLKSPGVTPDQARAFQAKLWRLHVDSQKPSTKLSEAKTEDDSLLERNDKKTAMNQEMLSSSADPDPKAAQRPFKERIRPGMVVRWSPPPAFSLGIDGMNMVVVLSPQSAVRSKVRDVSGELINDASKNGEGNKYLCAMVLPGFMADSYELSMWRQVVVDVDEMEAEVLLEYDTATRYYYVTV